MRVSVPLVRRVCVAALVGALCVTAIAIAAWSAGPVAVKATTRDEQAPAANSDWLAWAKSRKSGPFDAWAQNGSKPPFKVNPSNTQAYPGGVYGSLLVYQQITGLDSSDLRLYDLAHRRQLRMPAGVNTKGWECCATLNRAFLLFTRGSPETRQLQLVILRNLSSGEQRILDSLRSTNGALSAGQVNGNYAVWSRCDPDPRCQILRYDLAARTKTALVVPPGKDVYAPSVNGVGTTYYLRSNRGCGKSVELVKEPVTGGATVLTAFPQGSDGGLTYAFTSRVGTANITHVYYDRVTCRTKSWDIYRIDDVDQAPPPPLGLRPEHVGRQELR